MSGEKTEIEVYTTRTFDKVFNHLSERAQEQVDEAIEVIIAHPKIGEQKKGDLNYLRVYKFDLEGQQALLGYHFKEQMLEIYLMYLDSHENFYRDAKHVN